MNTKIVWTLSAALLVSAATATAQQLPPVRIFITSVGAQNGFTDPSKENRDAVKDLQKKLADPKQGVSISESRDAAQIVITVTGRERVSDGTKVGIGTSMQFIVRAKVSAAGIETEMTGQEGGYDTIGASAWGAAANNLAKQIKTWVAENRGKF